MAAAAASTAGNAEGLLTLGQRQMYTCLWAGLQAACTRLRPHLGPVLFQFPTNFRTTSGKGDKVTSNIERLRRLGEVRCCWITAAQVHRRAAFEAAICYGSRVSLYAQHENWQERRRCC